MKKKGKVFYSFLGALTGFANGLFGSGGGIIAVPMLEKVVSKFDDLFVCAFFDRFEKFKSCG